MNIKEKLKEIIEASLAKMNINNEEVIIDIPKNKEYGDYSTNIAMKISKKFNQDSLDIANTISNHIQNNNLIKKVDIVKPGFINFYINNEELLKIINEINHEQENFGRIKSFNKEKINVEFVSANPTGTLHLGHARGAAYGDSLCRILEFAGYEIVREYYINDDGNQINNLGLSIRARYKSLCGIDEEMPKDGYYGEDVKEIAQEIYKEFNDNCLDKDVLFFKEYGLKILLEKIKKDLALFRVKFDVWTSEREIRQKGRIEQSIKILNDLGKTYEKDGALWLKTTLYGDEKDRVLIKQDGEYAYITPDIANHLNKFDRGFDKLIDIFGADHHGYLPRLKAAIEALGYDKKKLEIKIIQLVKLFKGNEEIKMSKRTGNVVTMKELIDEVGLDATRYFFAMRNIDSKMYFDIEIATKKSNDNPFYYVSYAHARICSILKNYSTTKNITKFETINSENAYNIVAKLHEFTSVINASAEKKTPHLITNYVYDLANLFHVYYASEKILTEDIKYTNERLVFLNAIRIVINNALNLIGVKAPEKM